MATFNYIRNSSKDIYKPNLLYRPQQGTIIVSEDTTLDVELEIARTPATVTFYANSDLWGTIEVYLNNNLYITIDLTTENYTLNCYIDDVVGIKPSSLGLGYDFNGVFNYFYSTQQTEPNYHTITQTTNEVTNIYSFSCCVPYYSQIMLADNVTKSAEDVKIGDIILGYNEKTNEYQSVDVLNVIKKSRNDMCKVIFEDDTFMELTPDHPILTDYGWSAYQPETSAAYKSMGLIHQLTTQQKVLQLNGEYKQIKDIEYNILEQPIDVYTFNTTEGIDTYIAENCVVHNACDPV